MRYNSYHRAPCKATLWDYLHIHWWGKWSIQGLQNVHSITYPEKGGDPRMVEEKFLHQLYYWARACSSCGITQVRTTTSKDK